MPDIADALALAAAGWAILPLRGKVPITAHGLHDATTDPLQIREWWRGNAQHNIGARVPRALLVLDFDPQNGGSVAGLEAATGVAMPATLTVHSGRGTGGQHRYYLNPGAAVSSSRLPKGIDIKTHAGYCVMPPSTHPATGRPYTWENQPVTHLPRPIMDLITPPAPTRRRFTHQAPLSERALHLVRYVSELKEGNRNAGLYWAARRAVEEGHAGDVFDMLEAAATIAGLTEREAARTISSAKRGGIIRP